MERVKRTPRPKPDAATESCPDFTGTAFGDFRILRRLGQGGMGEVYLAEQVSLKRKVAIKLIREDVAANATALERFKAESKTVAQLSHANVVQVYMVGEHEGRHYMVLEYVEGKSLRDYLTRKGPLDILLALSLLRQVALALHRASEMGIVHRDIKPENILLTRKGEAKVADFGLSRCLAVEQPFELTRAGTTVGTPLYMSPEQVEGKVADYRSDLYSLGVTCYHMLTGKLPYGGSNAYEIALKHVREEPPALETVRPDVPASLCAIVRKLMAKKPLERYQSAYELLKDIARVRESLNGTTGCIPVNSVVTETALEAESSQSETVPLWNRPAVRWGAAAAAVFIVLVVGLTAWAVSRRRPPAETETADLKTPAGVTEHPAVNWPTADTAAKPDSAAVREESLKKMVEQTLKESLPHPSGVDACIQLAVLYLDENRVGDAEAVFRRMDERRPPSTYHYVGRLGLAVTDALNHKYSASHARFAELFDPRGRDNHVAVLNDCLAKNPEFAKWVNEADSHNVRNGITESSLPQGLRRPSGKSPFRRP